MFKDRLRYLRTSCGYSMDDLVDQYNKRFNGKMNKSTLSRYENGLQEPMIYVAKNLAELFDVSVDFLTRDSEEKPTTVSSDGLDPEHMELLKSLSKADLDIVLSVARQMKQRENQSEK
jgi:transcriptional regulator with XRE-family HTH domain